MEILQRVEKKSKIPLTNYYENSEMSLKELSTEFDGLESPSQQSSEMEIVEESIDLCDRIKRAKRLAKSAKDLISTPIPSRHSEMSPESESTLKEEDSYIWSQSSYLKHPQSDIMNFESQIKHNPHHFHQHPSYFGSSKNPIIQQKSKKMGLKGFPSFSW